MRHFASLLLALALVVTPLSASAEQLTIAAASDLRYALDDIVEQFREQHPDHELRVVYGSSGKMTTQIINGAPYDIFFSADIAFPRKLAEQGITASTPAVYAFGRIVLWSNTHNAAALVLEDLQRDNIRRIAIAQPAHAPYGMRAREALRSAGVWEAVQGKLVYGENIAHAAQMVESGAADVGIIALSLAKFPRLAEHGHHLIDDVLHEPLTQAYIVTRRGADQPAAADFAAFMETDAARGIMQHYGFVMPD